MGTWFGYDRCHNAESSLYETQAQAALDRVQQAAAGSENLVPVILAAVQSSATLGEISDALRSVWGEYREQVVV